MAQKKKTKQKKAAAHGQATSSAETQAAEAYDARAWKVPLACPTCANMTVIGYLLVDEQGEHMHTRYVCTFWPTGARAGLPYQETKRCGWEGWSVPGWNAT